MGGAHGHISHLHEDRQLTFGELKAILSTASEGRLERVHEKVDGTANIVFTWFDAEGLRVARSGGDIKRGGMDADELAEKFAGRGPLADAFNEAFTVLKGAVSMLTPEQRQQVFGDGRVWFSAEVVYPAAPNVVNYDVNAMVLHTTHAYVVTDIGSVEPLDAPAEGDVLASNVATMQRAIEAKKWRISGPIIVDMKRITDGTALNAALGNIERAMANVGVGDDDTLEDYLRAWMRTRIATLDITEEAKQMTLERSIEADGASTLVDIRKYVGRDQYASVNAFVKQSPALLKLAIAPIEDAVHRFAVQVLKGMSSAFIANAGVETARVQRRVQDAIEVIKSKGDHAALNTLQRQLAKLGSVDDVDTPVEGVVFRWKGKTYKLTGMFAPVNRILGLVKQVH